MNEQQRKLEIIRAWMSERSLSGLYLQTAASFAWATCGGSSYINTASSFGAASLLITLEHQYLLTTNIEAPRLEKEELLMAQGWEFKVEPWYAASSAAADLSRGLKLASDMPFPGAVELSADLARLRACLTPEEDQRFGDLGKACAQAMNAACMAVKPGQTEYQMAGIISEEAGARGAQPIVVLIASDERIFSLRHPLPTSKKLEKYAMLVLCGRTRGLVCSITRLVHFGHLPADLKQKVTACAQVDAVYINATRPGATLSEIFEKAMAAYSASGYPGEWQNHHQGGPCGYEPREYLATPISTDRVVTGQVYAWNPSITGYKSEDTILVGERHNEVLTEIQGWPSVTVDGISRPIILEL